jgi:hypothetical protein
VPFINYIFQKVVHENIFRKPPATGEQYIYSGFFLAHLLAAVAEFIVPDWGKKSTPA